jgi:tetratricopeptide (TPR) repeat protein
MNAGQYREAASCFRAILNEKPIIETAKGRLATCLEEEGNIFFSKKNFSEALKCYQ